MGELPFFRAHTAFHPDRLWIWEKAVYVDENQRTWLPITIEVRPIWGQAGRAAWASPSLVQPGEPETPQAVQGP